MKFIILLLLFIRPLFALDVLTPPADITDVKVFVYIGNISKVDDNDSKATLDFFLITKWQDQRLAGKFRKRVKIPADEIWTPDIQILNERELFGIMGRDVEVFPGGNIKHTQRFSGKINIDTDFKNYPFDGQILQIILFSPDNEVKFVADEKGALRHKNFTNGKWKFGEPTIIQRELEFSNKVDIKRPIFIVQLEGKRLGRFFIWRVVVPICFFLFLGWSIFYIDPRSIEARITVSFTIILTLLAHMVMVIGKAPQLNILSKMDIFYIGAILLTFFIFGTVIYTHSISDKDVKRSNKISHKLGWIYLGFLVILIGYAVI